MPQEVTQLPAETAPQPAVTPKETAPKPTQAPAATEPKVCLKLLPNIHVRPSQYFAGDNFLTTILERILKNQTIFTHTF